MNTPSCSDRLARQIRIRAHVLTECANYHEATILMVANPVSIEWLRHK